MSAKMKTHRGAAKRFKVTARGHVKFKRAKMRHILGSKDQKMKRRLRHAGTLCPADEKVIRQVIPYK